MPLNFYAETALVLQRRVTGKREAVGVGWLRILAFFSSASVSFFIRGHSPAPLSLYSGYADAVLYFPVSPESSFVSR